MAEDAERESLTRGFLFADLRGYTEYVERHGGEAAARLLDRYRLLVRDLVARFRGAEIKTEGDSFYVVFPSVSAAVRAGLAILDDARVASQQEPEHPIRVGIGVHAGETIQTAEGYVGSPVNIAARLCALARAGELLVSDTVRALTSTVVRAAFVPRGRQHLKGIAEPIAVFAVIKAGAPAVARRSPRVRTVAPVMGAVAAVVVVALVAALASMNRAFDAAGATPAASGASPASATPASSAAGPSALTSVERELLGLLPSDMEEGCLASPHELLPLSLATFRCELPVGSGADIVWWDMLASKSETALAIERIGRAHELTSADSECSPDVSTGMGQWSLGLTFSGTRVCWVDDSGAWVAWTYGDERVLARAVRADGDAMDLHAWWEDVAPFLKSR